MSTNVSHHNRQEYCTTRLKYRQGRELKAVKVYTIANESQYLLVFGVPKVNLCQEIKRKLQRFGAFQYVNCVTEEMAKKMQLELFTDVYLVKFYKIEHARRTKRFLDATQFYGGILHISFAPEYESLTELRQKLQKRKKEVDYRLRINAKVAEELQYQQQQPDQQEADFSTNNAI